MCGFVGYVVGSSELVKNSTILTDAIETIHHRGPDNTGVWISENGHAALAHKRLSILDLSERSNQPFQDALNHLITVFNGEIYNYLALRDDLVLLGHSFSTNSDTEVISKGYAEWGSDIFCKLEGMFAIAIIDNKNNKIFLARDRAGEKPLFYSIKSKTFSFASEIKPLLKLNFVNNDIDYESLHHLFNRGYSPASKSIYSEIAKLDAAEFLEFNIDNSEWHIEKFWNLKKKIIKKRKFYTTDENYLVKKLENLLEVSIDKQLHADVPVGMLLSGGVDSSLMVALGSRNHKNLSTFNIAFNDHSEFNESHYARLISKHFKCNHHEIDASTIDPSMFDQLPYYYDEPIFDTSIIPTFLLSAAVSKHSKVAIGGDGGDELFGGYPHYNKFLQMDKNVSSAPHFLRTRISNYMQSILPIGMKGKKTLEFFGTDFKKYYPNIAEFYNEPEIIKIFNKKILPPDFKKYKKQNSILPVEDLILSSTFHDFSNYLKSDLLVKVDRASMANSLEIRSPFLDKKIIEFAFLEVPSHLKVTRQQRKILLKMLANKILPKNFDYERKQGFSIPVNTFLTDPIWSDYFYQKVSDSDPNIFNKDYIFKLLKASGKFRNNGERIAALVFFMCWVEEFKPNFYKFSTF